MKNLIVPFLFCNKPQLKNFAWIFCKYVDFCVKNDMPIITEEEYCRNIDLIKEYEQGANPSQWYCTAKSPTVDLLNYTLKSVFITVEEKKRYFGNCEEIDTLSALRRHLCYEEDQQFEKLINDKIDEVESVYGSITVIMTWIRYPSLVKCAKQRGITVLAQELSSIRGNDYYREVYGYFNFATKYTYEKVASEYKEIEQLLDKEVILNRKEILALVLQSEHLDVINRLEESIYEFGVDADAERDMFFSIYSGLSWKNVLNDLETITDKSNVLARFHPATSSEERNSKFEKDTSINSLEWILKCRRIVSGISNVGFESMLLGRTAYVLSQNIPYYYGNVQSLKYIEEKSSDIKLLNYMLFAYFAPWEKMFDCDYINWRLQSPSIIEIYRYNLSFSLQKAGLKYLDVIDMGSEERFERILKGRHGLPDEQLQTYIKRSKQKNYSDLQKDFQQEENLLKAKINDTESKIEELSKELSLLKNSTSWKITKPLRSLGQWIRK